jgi:hypothetical protein
MRLALKLHPDCICEAVTRIEVDVVRPGPGALALHYRVTGAVGGLRLPAVSVPARADGLWQHTCFEAFLRAPAAQDYYELNFAPSGEWAAYRFSGYRSGRSDIELEPPGIETRATGERYELRATAQLPGMAPWQLGLCVVIEEANGRKSYWALAHPPGKADFHHPDSFVHELPAA